MGNKVLAYCLGVATGLVAVITIAFVSTFLFDPLASRTLTAAAVEPLVQVTPPTPHYIAEHSALAKPVTQ